MSYLNISLVSASWIQSKAEAKLLLITRKNTWMHTNMHTETIFLSVDFDTAHVIALFKQNLF